MSQPTARVPVPSSLMQKGPGEAILPGPFCHLSQFEYQDCHKWHKECLEEHEPEQDL